MTLHNPKQRYLISPEAVFGLKPLRQYELLFETLEPCLGGCFHSKTRGRPPTSKPALLYAFIYKNLKQLPTLFELASILVDNSSLTTTCGLLPNKTLYSLEERLSSSGGRICIAGFEMLYWGKFNDRRKIRKKFVGPITNSKKFTQQIPACLWNHPAFRKGKGCMAYLRGDKDVRKEIDYGSQIFKEHYNKRTASERVFSRLLTLCMQKPSVYGLNAVSNHCTIAHITVLLIALSAARTGQIDKVRFVKKFLPNL